MNKPYYQEENITIYNGDCLEVMGGFTDKQFDLCLTDPPYGVKRDEGFEGFEGFGGFGKPIARKRYVGGWDNSRPEKEYFDEILRTSKEVLIFGGNYFADILPQGKHWIVWDKLNTMPTFGDCELIWTSLNRKSVKKITWEYNGLIGKEKQRYHATQKPQKLINDLIDKYSNENDTILDPFLGSGTTARACKDLGRKCIGIEISKEYCDIAVKRLAQEVLPL
jgi:DNA modification methylase